MSKIKQLWTLARFQLALTPRVLFLALGSGFPCIDFVLFRNSNVPASLDLLLSGQMIYFSIIFGPQLLTPELGGYHKEKLWAWASGTEFLLTRAVDRKLLYRSRSLLFFFLLLIIPLLSLAVSLRHPNLNIFESSDITYHRVMQGLTGSIPEAPDKDGKLKEIFLPNGNILFSIWRIWLPLCFGVAILTILTVAKKLKYISWLILAIGFGLILCYCFKSSFFHGSQGLRGDGLDLNTALFFFFASHQSLCWLIAITALLISLFWYENEPGQLK